MKLALDHHYPLAISEQLRELGHDVVAAIERGWHRESDEVLLELCSAEQRVLLTNNVGDFVVLARAWAISGRSHAGLIFTSDASMPRTHGTIGMYVQRVDAVLREHPSVNTFADRIHWL